MKQNTNGNVCLTTWRVDPRAADKTEDELCEFKQKNRYEAKYKWNVCLTTWREDPPAADNTEDEWFTLSVQVYTADRESNSR